VTEIFVSGSRSRRGWKPPHL